MIARILLFIEPNANTGLSRVRKEACCLRFHDAELTVDERFFHIVAYAFSLSFRLIEMLEVLSN
jgi:hypothetical protein